jgi:hypothetical protein
VRIQPTAGGDFFVQAEATFALWTMRVLEIGTTLLTVVLCD